MKTFLPFFLLLFLCAFHLNAQEEFSQKDFDALAASVQEVASNGNTFEQHFSIQASGKLNELAFETTITDKKGKSRTERYEFNLLDLDAGLVSRDLKGKTMYLIAKTEGGQKFIKSFVDGEQESFRNYFLIAVNGVDEFRELEEKLEEAIRKAKTAQMTDFSAMSFSNQLKFLQDNIVNAKVEDTEFQQKLSTGEPAYLITLQIEERTPKADEKREAKFNLADLSEKSVRMEVSGRKMFVEMTTDKKKDWIEFYDEGVLDAFEDGLEIVINNTTEGRNIVAVLKELIPAAREMEEKKMAALNARQDSREKAMIQFVGDVKTPKSEWQQKLEGSCILKFTQTENNGGDKTEVNEYAFNLIDFDKSKTTIKPSGDLVLVLIESKERLIKHLQNGEAENYTDEIKFYTQGIEDAKGLAFVLEKQMESCQETSGEDVFAGKGTEALLTSCTNLVSNVEMPDFTYIQKIEPMEGNSCKVQFTRIKSEKSKDEEMTYEFILSDINAKSIDFQVSGRELSVQLLTDGKEKIIKRYIGEEKSDFVADVEIFMNNVEDTRSLINSLKALVAACEE